MTSRFDLIWSEEDLETHREKVAALIRAEEGTSRARTLDVVDILPWWRGSKPLSEALAELKPYGVRTVHGGGVARAYMKRWWRAETTVGAVAWIRSGEGPFPLAVGVAVRRVALNTAGDVRESDLERVAKEAVRAVREGLEKAEDTGLSEPVETYRLGHVIFRKRALSTAWEEVGTGNTWLKCPYDIQPEAHKLETTARKLAAALGLQPSTMRRLLRGEGDAEEAEKLFVLALMARMV